MTIKMDGSQQMTLLDRISSIPLPRFWLTDKEWRGSIVSELRPYFIFPRMDHSTFLNWINANLGIRELSEEDLRSPDLKQQLDVFRKGSMDRFWLLEKNDRSNMFFEFDFQAGDLTSEEYDDGWIVIGYHPELDIFYSSSIFLNNVLAYFRGINPEDLLNESRELFPICSALSYANNLDGVLRSFSAYRGIQIIHRILHAKTLTVFGPQGKTVGLSGDSFFPIFQKIFSSDIYMNTQYPQEEDDRTFRLDFLEADNSRISLYLGGRRLYYGQREYYELREMAAQLTNWLKEFFNHTSFV